MPEGMIDPEAWETLKSMTDPAFLVELIDVYLSDSVDLIEQMRGGLENGDCETVRRAAHSLKSNSASLGAKTLAEAARSLEMLAKAGGLEGGETRLAEIENQYRQIAPVLAELKK